MLKALPFLMLLAVSVQSFGQTAKIDSLRQVILNTKDTRQKTLNRFFIGKEFMKIKPDSTIAIGKELLATAEKAKNLNEIGEGYELIARGYYRNAEYQKALEINEKNLEVHKLLKDTETIAAIKVNMGNAYEMLDQPDEAMNLYLEALTVFEQLKNYKTIGILYTKLGSVMTSQKKGKEALYYYHKGLSIKKKFSTEDDLYYSYADLGLLHNELAQYDSAIYYYKLAIPIGEKSENKTLAAGQYSNLGVAYLNQKKYDAAEAEFTKALPVMIESGNKYYIGEVYRSLAKVANAKKNYSKAIEYLNAALPNIEGTDVLRTKQGVHEDLVDAYKGLGDYKNALLHKEIAIDFKDSINFQTDEKTMAEMNAKFKTTENEAKIANQQLELEQQSSQKKTILIIGIALLLALGGGFQYFRNKQRIKQKDAELSAQLEHAEAEKLREMDAMKSTFFANISHEFRTPLTLIVSPLEQMMGGSFQGDFQKYYCIMHRNGKRLLDLVNQLLDLSRLESGKLKLQVAEGDLVGFTKAVAYSFESLAVRKQIDYQVIVEEAPPCFFDKDKVEKIMNNLISNAFKFTKDGKRIVVSGDFTGGKAIFKVKDEGMGIPADQLPHIFERFAKTVTSELQPGSGIGLALTKELVERHKGKMEVESLEGEGTTFTVSFPIVKSSYAQDEIIASQPEKETLPSKTGDNIEKTMHQVAMYDAFSSLHKPILLVVEDNADVRNYIVDQFREQYQIVEAENGRFGLEKALETTPDLIISDIMMPEMDGTEFCKLLKTNEKTSHIPVIMLTALAEQGDRIKGLELGADDYLVKPFDAKELTVRVANLIAGRQKLQEYYRRSLNSFAPIADVKAESVDAVFLKKVREAVEANLEDENFSVVELSGQVGMSRSQLHRKLSALTGFSPNEVIRNMRLEKAKQLLEKRVGNASEVSYMTGFNSPAYFAKCFKDYFGVTPSEVV